ncbi:MAG: glycosyltransferase family 4 protein [Bacteroidota bacterium]
MPVKPRYITFFTPSMHRTGSEIVLFNLISHISDIFSVKIVSVFKGSLLPLFNEKHIITFIHKKRPDSFISKLKFKITEQFFIPWILKGYHKSTWYINTIVLWDYLKHAEEYKIKVILHVHELEQIFALLSKEQLARIVDYPELIIANSNYTTQLLQSFGRTKPIELCYPAINTKEFVANKETKSTYRKKLKISESAFVWAMCGSLDDNKNPELFIDVAFELMKVKPNSIFIWIGGTADVVFENKCKAYALEKKVANNILWINIEGEEYRNYFNCADGFVLTSKKESFSIVTLEALLLELPIVANDCGGVKEILRDDVGVVIKDKGNVDQFVNAMLNYMDNNTVYDKVKGILRAQEFDLNIWSKKWNAILDNYTK